MAEPPTLPKAPFPSPPPFWQQFTVENVERLEFIKKENNPTSSKSEEPHRWKPSELRALELPTELRYLIPPPPPTEPTYRVFNNEVQLALSFPALPKLPSDHRLPSNPAVTLHLLTKSLLLNFGELTSLLATDPSSAHEKTEDMQTLYYHIHDLINQYRPHQARETLISMMEEQVRRGKGEIEECERVMGKVRDLLEEVGGNAVERTVPDVAEAIGGSGKEKKRAIEGVRRTVQEDRKDEEARWLWDKVHEIEND